MSYNNTEHFTINSNFFVNIYKNYNNIGIKHLVNNNKGGGDEVGHGSTVGYRPNDGGGDEVGHGSTVG